MDNNFRNNIWTGNESVNNHLELDSHFKSSEYSNPNPKNLSTIDINENTISIKSDFVYNNFKANSKGGSIYDRFRHNHQKSENISAPSELNNTQSMPRANRRNEHKGKLGLLRAFGLLITSK